MAACLLIPLISVPCDCDVRRLPFEGPFFCYGREPLRNHDRINPLDIHLERKPIRLAKILCAVAPNTALNVCGCNLFQPSRKGTCNATRPDWRIQIETIAACEAYCKQCPHNTSNGFGTRLFQI